MEQFFNIPDEAHNDNHSRDTSELTELAFPYLLQLFHAGLETRHGQRISIQCTDSGTFRGALTAIKDLGKPTEFGVVAFTNAESFGGILAYFEDGLTYGELKWRPDKYWAEARVAKPEAAQKRQKRELRL